MAANSHPRRLLLPVLGALVLGLGGFQRIHVGARQAASAAAAERAPGLYAEVQTNKGLIVIQLRPQYAPIAVASFVGLAEGTIDNAALPPGQPYFDGSKWHRVVPDHVIQTGIPAGGRSNGPGYMFPNEIDVRLSHNHAGAVNMANGGPNTNASQWCITLDDRSYLDGDYTVFGEVVYGLDVAFRIVQGDSVATVRIVRSGAAAQAYHPTTASFHAMVEAANRRVTAQAGLKAAAERAWIAAHYPQAAGPDGGVLVERTQAGSGAAPAAGTPIAVQYTGRVVRYVGDWRGHSGSPIETVTFGSGADGTPGFIHPAQTFSYVPGKTRLNPGLESVLAKMQPGERDIVIVPAALGYGRAGLYPPAVVGRPRFVVNPNALLVYDVRRLQ